MNQDPKQSYEKRDANTRVVFIAAGLLVMVSLFVGLASFFVLRLFSRATPPVQMSPLPPEPRLQTNPLADLEALRAKEDQVLNHYGWVDRSKGVVRIPVDRAMDLVAQRGLPARHTAETKE